MSYLQNFIFTSILIGILYSNGVFTTPVAYVTNPLAKPGDAASHSSVGFIQPTGINFGILPSGVNVPKGGLTMPSDSGSDSLTLDDTEPDDPASDTDGPSDGQLKEDLYPDLQTCRNNCNVPTGKSVFYCRVGPHEEKPQMFANTFGGVLMRESFPQHFTDPNPAYTGYSKFMQRTSQAFAEKTAGTTYVLLPTDGTDIRKKVWTRFEKPALQAPGGQCNKIYKIDPLDFNSRCLLWDRNGATDPQYPNCQSEVGPIPPARAADTLYAK